MNEIYSLHQGTAPLFISLPHNGTIVPEELAARMTPAARNVPDTDWHVSHLYSFARELGASMIVPSHSRYVIDLNRPQDDTSLYPGRNTTGLCPSVQFSGEPIYAPGEEPSQDEVHARIEKYWRPYHAALATEIARIKAMHGRVVLWEGHSIKSVVPFLFEGRLPDFNLGTADGKTCAPELQRRLTRRFESQNDFTFVVNGRFKGGYITRRYGDPGNGVDAVQLELAQCNYMDENSFEIGAEKLERTSALIRELLQICLAT
jgi:N-formylglutamate deformylase